MQQHYDVVTTPTGRPIAGATVTVTYTETGAAASLYAGNESTPIVGNVLTTDAQGEYGFYSFNGRYTLTIAAPGYGSSTRYIRLYDPEDYEEVALKKFGLMVPGSNNTTAIQAALTAAAADKLCIVCPSGTWEATELNVAGNMRVRGVDKAVCTIKQRGSTNANFITVAYTVVSPPIFEHLTIDGTRSANTTGHAVYLEPHAEADASVTYGFAINMLNCIVQNAAEMCLYVGRNRNYGRMHGSEFKRGDTGCVYMTASSDWQYMDSAFAFPISGPALEIVSGAANTVIGGAAFGAVDAPAVRITNAGSSATVISGVTLNFNQREAVQIIGNTGTARHLPVQIDSCLFADNGLAADNTYSHIKLTDTAGAVISDNGFRWLGTGNRCKYLVEFTGVYLPAEWVGNSYDRVSNVPYGTAVSNSPANLAARFQALQSSGRTLLGGDAGAESLIVEQGVASGDYWSAQGRAAGSGPTLLAGGAGADIPARVSSKGAAAVEILTGGLNRRVMRFLDTASAVNWLVASGAATGGPVTLGAASSTDTHVDLLLAPQGSSGRVRFGAYVGTPVTSAGYFEMKTEDGVVRKVMLGT